MASVGKILRRTFLFGTVAVVGGAAFGAWYVGRPAANPLEPKDGETVMNPWVVIDENGITLVSPHAEMGQGTHTTWAAMLAEELDVTLEQVTIIKGPAAKAYYNGALAGAMFEGRGYNSTAFQRSMGEVASHLGKVMNMQITGASTAIKDGYERMRVTGAATREALKRAAADQLDVDVRDLTTEAGEVIAPDGTRLPYTTLAAAAAEIEIDRVDLRPQSEWKILGTNFMRQDIVAKSTGTATFGIDARFDGQKFAAIRIAPTRAGMKSFEGRDAARLPGVEKVVDLGNGVAVIANNTWVAQQAVDSIPVEWEEAGYLKTTEDMMSALEDGFDQEPNSVLRDDGDASTMPEDAQMVEAEYRLPFLSHATMEPMNATAWFQGGKLKVVCGAQSPLFIQAQCASEAGLSVDDVEVDVPFLGGGFGRRGEVDFAVYATRVAKAVPGTPVQVTWSREEDMTHDFYRPAAIGRMKGAVRDGTAVALDARVSSAFLMAPSLERAAGFAPGGPDQSIVEGIFNQPYGIENFKCRGYAVAGMPPVGFWRAVGSSINGFVMESFIDELAHAAGADPIDFRMAHTRDEWEPAWEVLNAVKEMCQWTGETPEGVGRGVAMCYSFGTPVAMVIEVRDEDGLIRLTNAWIAADPGVALAPDNIEAQLVGGMVYGLSAAIGEEITFADGVAEQKNFPDYEPLRMSQMPQTQVRILEIQEHVGGIGEPGTPPAAPALANALFDLKGQRYRTLPLKKALDFYV